ncbi:UNVERIFIED_ORG: hypothetical protein GGE63_005932 [Rhizobium esperanzae]|nr:hypothetical protein Bra5_PD00548 [Rhizobium phaseoli Brasil 5]
MRGLYAFQQDQKFLGVPCWQAERDKSFEKPSLPRDDGSTISTPMADDSTTTIRATFETREAADRAVEHLVQQHGISRPDIFIQSANNRNTAGAAPSGGGGEIRKNERIEVWRSWSPLSSKLPSAANRRRSIPAIDLAHQ